MQPHGFSTKEKMFIASHSGKSPSPVSSLLPLSWTTATVTIDTFVTFANCCFYDIPKNPQTFIETLYVNLTLQTLMTCYFIFFILAYNTTPNLGNVEQDHE